MNHSVSIQKVEKIHNKTGLFPSFESNKKVEKTQKVETKWSYLRLSVKDWYQGQEFKKYFCRSLKKPLISSIILSYLCKVLPVNIGTTLECKWKADERNQNHKNWIPKPKYCSRPVWHFGKLWPRHLANLSRIEWLIHCYPSFGLFCNDFGHVLIGLGHSWITFRLPFKLILDYLFYLRVQKICVGRNCCKPFLSLRQVQLIKPLLKVLLILKWKK